MKRRRPPITRVIPFIAALTAAGWLGPLPAAQAETGGCATTQSNLDLNGDGYDDAVVGDPYATVAGKVQAGSITVLYGDADRRIGEGPRMALTQASVPGSHVEAGDHFGWAVAVDDATGDGCADILVGSPGEDWSGHADAGIVHLISFTPDGKGGPGRATAVVADQSQLAGTVETGDQFGYAVALSNYRGGDEPLGAVGAPGEDLRGVADAGVVNTFSVLGSPALVDQREQGRQGDRWLPGVPEAGDRFGASVIIAPMQVRQGDDTGVEPTFVAGAPGDTVREGGAVVDDAGSLTTWDSVTAFQQLVTQDSPGVPGTAEAGDHFGSSLAHNTTTVGAAANRALAVGSPGEDVGSVTAAGSVTVFADVAGSGLEGRRAVHQNTPGIDGVAETGDAFGTSVAFRPDSETTSLLVIGAPGEDVGSVLNAGMAQTVAVTAGVSQLTPVRSYTENSVGTPGRVATGNRFGRTVVSMTGRDESLFAISSPYQDVGSMFVVDGSGTTRAWVPGQGGIPASTGDRFGWSASGLGSES